MITHTELQRMFAQLKTPEAGRIMIERIRSDGPVRSVQRNTDTVRTRLISSKMNGRALLAESRTVELPAFIRHENKRDTLEYYPQPATLEYIVRSLSGAATRRSHTPDIFEITPDAFIFHEWREEVRLQRLAMERPSEFYKDPDGRWNNIPAEERARELGCEYQLHSADEHPRILVANMEFLGDYNRTDTPLVPITEIARLRAMLDERPIIPHLELIHNHRFSADDLFQMILQMDVYVDLVSTRLDLVNDLLIFRDEVTSRANSIFKTETTLILPPSAIILRAGSEFLYDANSYTVTLVGTSEVIATDAKGNTTRLPLSLVQELFNKDLIVGTSQSNSVKTQYDVNEVIANQTKLAGALTRLEAIRDPECSTISARSVRRYKQKIAGVDSPQEQLQLLMSGNSGNRFRRVSEQVMQLAERAVKEHHNQAKNPTVAATHAYFITLCDGAGLLPMRRSAFYEWIKSKENTEKREGRRAAYQKAAIPLTLDYEHPVHGVLPHEIVYIDNTTLNQFVRGMVLGNLGKPCLTIAVDGALSMTRAMYMSFDAPSCNSVLMVLRDYVRRHGRLPKTIVLDNGAEFHSLALKLFCSLFQINMRWRRRSKPRDSTLVERMLGAVEEEVISSLDGNTICLKDPRNVSPEVQPENFIKWTLPALYGSIEHYLFQVHPERVHPRFGISSADYEKKLNLECGNRAHIFVKYDAQLKLLTSPHAKGKPRKVDRRNGVYVDGMWYMHDKFDQAKPREAVEVRCEMWCASVVYVCFRGDWLVAQARDGGQLTGRFRHEVEIARRTESRARKSAAQRDKSSVKHARGKTLLWIPEIWDERLREQATEAYYLYEKLGMAEALPLAKNTRGHLVDPGTPQAIDPTLLRRIAHEADTSDAEIVVPDPGLSNGAPPVDADENASEELEYLT